MVVPAEKNVPKTTNNLIIIMFTLVFLANPAHTPPSILLSSLSIPFIMVLVAFQYALFSLLSARYPNISQSGYLRPMTNNLLIYSTLNGYSNPLLTS